MSIRTPATLLSMLLGFSAINTTVATEVAMCTDAGRIVIELNEDAAPLHAENFLRNVAIGQYTGTVFHRVIDDFMVQGGGFNRDLEYRGGAATVRNESRNGLSNERGTVAAARTADPHSAASQFFINTVNNRRLDAGRSDWGYTVFGAVTEGMDVVDRIGALPTGQAGPFADDVPVPLIAILAASVLDRDALAEIEGPDLEAALLARIDAAAEADAPVEALQWISHYRSLCAPAGPDLLMAEARYAFATKMPVRANFVLEEFFATTTESHQDHDEALRLYESLSGDNAINIDTNVCNEPQTPAIADGSRDSLEVMVAAQSRVQQFMSDSTEYLECMGELIDQAQTIEAADLEAQLVESYNRMVDLTQEVGDDFNAQVREFRERQ